MVLVDTSIWIDYVSARPGAAARRLDELAAAGTPFALTPVILQEILQGARSRHEFRRLRRNLLTQRFIFPLDPVGSYVAASEIYFRCRRAGVTPRSTIDCLIAQIAVENQAALLHNDADFERIATVVTELVIY
ncbi:MAG TPA: PIN domain-containing protein [Anaerolineae bacterium]